MMSILEKFELKLELDQKDDVLLRSPARGALMHGLLMGELDGADLLHAGSAFRPFSQSLRFDSPGTYIWTINLLHSDAQPIARWLENAAAQVSEFASMELHIKHYDARLRVQQIEKVETITYSDLLEESLKTLPPKFVTFEFLTPLIFKKAGQTTPTPFPEPRLIVNSALSRWNHFSDCANFELDEILDEISKYVSIFSFRMSSQHVAMDRLDFAGGLGQISYVINRPELRQIIYICGRFAEFAGLGAKTALGLGAVAFHPQDIRVEQSKPRTKEAINLC